MRPSHLSAVLVASAVVVSSPLHAQRWQGELVTVWNRPTSSAFDPWQSGRGLRVTALLALHARMGLEADASFATHPMDTARMADRLNRNSRLLRGGTATISSAFVGARASLPPSWRLSPYLHASTGVMRFSFARVDVAQLESWTFEGESAIAFKVGAGLSAQLWRRVHAVASADWVHAQTTNETTQFLPLSLGIHVR